MNLNEDYELGGSIGNDVDNYTNLTFRVYPKGDSSYTLVHSDPVHDDRKRQRGL